MLWEYENGGNANYVTLPKGFPFKIIDLIWTEVEAITRRNFSNVVLPRPEPQQLVPQ